jgi:hypothetical protein
VFLFQTQLKNEDKRMILRKRLDTLRHNLTMDVQWKPKKKKNPLDVQRKYMKYNIPKKLNVVVDVGRGICFNDIVDKYKLKNRRTVYSIIEWFRQRECEQAAAMDLLEYIADRATLPKGTSLQFQNDGWINCRVQTGCKNNPNKVSHLKKMCFKKQKGVLLSDSVAFLLGATSQKTV